MPARYELPAGPGGRLCSFQCREAQTHCHDSCGLMERGCTNAMQAQAIKDYEAYTVEQFKTKQPVELRARDFERPERCVAEDCRQQCQAVYNACFEQCGGRVVKPSACHFFCY